MVLCVDDSVMMRRTYEKRLASLNYDVVTAEDGEAALGQRVVQVLSRRCVELHPPQRHRDQLRAAGLRRERVLERGGTLGSPRGRARVLRRAPGRARGRCTVRGVVGDR